MRSEYYVFKIKMWIVFIYRAGPRYGYKRIFFFFIDPSIQICSGSHKYVSGRSAGLRCSRLPRKSKRVNTRYYGRQLLVRSTGLVPINEWWVSVIFLENPYWYNDRFGFLPFLKFADDRLGGCNSQCQQKDVDKRRHDERRCGRRVFTANGRFREDLSPVRTFRVIAARRNWPRSADCWAAEVR